MRSTASKNLHPSSYVFELGGTIIENSFAVSRATTFFFEKNKNYKIFPFFIQEKGDLQTYFVLSFSLENSTTLTPPETDSSNSYRE